MYNYWLASENSGVKFGIHDTPEIGIIVCTVKPVWKEPLWKDHPGWKDHFSIGEFIFLPLESMQTQPVWKDHVSWRICQQWYVLKSYFRVPLQNTNSHCDHPVKLAVSLEFDISSQWESHRSKSWFQSTCMWFPLCWNIKFQLKCHV